MRSVARLAALLAACALAGPAFAQKAASDPLASLPGQISAVFDIGAAPRLLVVEDDHGVSNARTLRIGDEYRSGWRVTGIDGQKVTLANGVQQRTVNVPSRARAMDIAAASAPSGLPGAFGGFASSNAAGGPGGGARIFVSPPSGARGARGGGMNLEAGMQDMLARLQRGEAPPEIAAMIQQMGPEAMTAMQNLRVRDENGVRTITGVGPNGETTQIQIGPNGERNVITARPMPAE